MNTSEIYRGIKKPFAVEDVGLKLEGFNKYAIERKVRDANQEKLAGEFLLLRKRSHNTCYQELSSERLFTEEELDMESLVPFNRMFDCKENISRRKVIKLYNAKMLEKLPVKNLVLGKIGYVSKLIRKDTDNEVQLTLKCSPIKSRALLLKENDVYTDLETHIKYPCNNFSLGNIIALCEEPIYHYLTSEDTKEDSIEYYKILSKYRTRIK